MRKRGGVYRRQKRTQGRRAASGAACRFQPKVGGPGGPHLPMALNRAKYLVDCVLNVDYEDVEGQGLLPYFEGETWPKKT